MWARSSAMFDASPASGTPGVLLGFIDGDDARALADQSDPGARQAALESYATLFRPAGRPPRMYFDQVWAREIYTGGCPVGVMPPGVLTEYGQRAAGPGRADPLGRDRDGHRLERLHGRRRAVRQAGRRRGFAEL